MSVSVSVSVSVYVELNCFPADASHSHQLFSKGCMFSISSGRPEDYHCHVDCHVDCHVVVECCKHCEVSFHVMVSLMGIFRLSPLCLCHSWEPLWVVPEEGSDAESEKSRDSAELSDDENSEMSEFDVWF